MSYKYIFTVLNDDDNVVVSIPLTADHAVAVLVEQVAKNFPHEPQPEPLNIIDTPPTTRRQNASAPASQPTVKTYKCGKCGKPGHQARKCPGTAKESTNSRKFTEDQFDSMMDLIKLDGMLNSKEFAEDNHLPISEVNRAVSSRTYKEYLNFI